MLSLAIEYYRLVTESTSSAWAQVYVKSPLGEEEVRRNGAIFGSLRMEGKEAAEKEVVLLRRIEEWCQDPANKGNLAGILTILKEEGATGIFTWVFMDESGFRRMKVGGVGEVEMGLVRAGGHFKLVTNGNGQVMVGNLKDGDVVILGDRELLSLFSRGDLEGEKEWDELVRKTQLLAEEKSKPLGAMVLLVKPMPAEEGGLAEEDLTIERSLSATPPQESLVSDRVVGATGWRSRFRQVQVSWASVLARRGQPKVVSEGQAKRHRWVLVVGGVFLVILAVSVSVGLVKAGKDRREAKLREIFEPLEAKRQEAESLYSLNPVGARELLRIIKEELAAKTGGQEDKELLVRKQKFEEVLAVSWEKVSGEQKAGLELFFNLELLRSGMKGSRLAFDGGSALVLDEESGVVAKVGIGDRKAEVILGKGQGKGWRDVAALGKNAVVVTKDGLLGFFSGKPVEAAYDGSVKEPVAVAMFGEAAYVLDKGASEIWRYVLAGGEIGERRRWLAVGVEENLAGAVDLSIDVDVWILMGDGKVKRFRRGNPERFSLTDLPSEFSPVRIAVSDEVGSLALLDPAKGRVVLFNKENGGFAKQLINPDLGKAVDLVFIDEKTLLVLVEGKLLKLLI